MTVTAILQARGLVMHYGRGLGRVEALRGVDLRVDEGELLAIVGPSGGGKSTLLHLLGLLEVPTGGEVVIEGRVASTLGRRGRAAVRNRALGFVFQSFNLLAHLSAAENVILPAVLAGRGGAADRRRAHHLLESVGVGELSGRLPGEMSGGQQQRVAIARALMLDPPILLADEPTGNLDSAASAAVLGLLEGCHRRGQTLVVVTHADDVARRADRIVEMRDGRLVEMPGDRLHGAPLARATGGPGEAER